MIHGLPLDPLLSVYGGGLTQLLPPYCHVFSSFAAVDI